MPLNKKKDKNATAMNRIQTIIKISFLSNIFSPAFETHFVLAHLLQQLHFVCLNSLKKLFHFYRTAKLAA